MERSRDCGGLVAEGGWPCQGAGGKGGGGSGRLSFQCSGRQQRSCRADLLPPVPQFHRMML